MRPGRHGLLLATALSAFALTACGGATVENDPGTDTSVAPLERAPQSTPAESDDESDDGGERPPAAPPASPQPQDQGAQEVSEVPTPQPERSGEDTAFLGGLSDGGIDVNGVEDQLIGAASTVCRAEESGIGEVTVTAVAGQLVEQQRTELTAEDAVALIENEARAAYC
ncbi:DUF732 domain-containing protein [Corynebacterium halotolerans]|uniref:DUF732 domain-containing protein n=1 Tax=Corynebacterium halotolerans YIM 70093 = DSM 44683 TaxID=1121362 RepID=M1NVW7_9CORY|nr:DUF732 domain-containing protein [Corynebacterium halotolerans]AGF73617.1 hypothetical protein A605_13105 [Corynebacterium halotolerans YIM 70093 = DSM 44683]